MTFPIKKKINTELFIEKRAAYFIQKGKIEEGKIVGAKEH